MTDHPKPTVPKKSSRKKLLEEAVPVPPELLDQIDELTEGMEVDFNKPLDPDDSTSDANKE